MDLLAQHQAHAGFWVALDTDGRAAGAGATGPEARLAATETDSTAELRVVYVADLAGHKLVLSDLLVELEPILAQIEFPVYLVGGAVRDAVLGKASHDLDFAVPRKGIKTAFKVGDFLARPAYALDKTRDTGRVMVADRKTYLDFVTFRGPDLQADLYDRDVTINAIAMPALARTTAELIDPFGGQSDLHSRIIRQIHENSLLNDPVRGLRVVRMAAQHDFTIEPATQVAARQALQQLDRPSIERVRDELINMLHHHPEIGLPLLHDLGGVAAIMPEVAALDGLSQSPPHRYDVLTHTWAVVAAVDEAIAVGRQLNREWSEPLEAHLARPVAGGVSGRDLLILGAIFHDVGKGATRTVEQDGRIRFLGHETIGAELAAERLRILRFSREAVKHVKTTVQGHMRPLLLANEVEVTPRAIHRFLKQTGAAGLDIGLLTLADHIGTVGGKDEAAAPWRSLTAVVTRLFDHYFTHLTPSSEQPPLIDGGMLMRELGLEPGSLIGRLLKQIEEAQVAGEITTPAEALALARSLISET